MTYRRAIVDDASAGARLHVACWREAYAPYVDAERLERLLGNAMDRRERMWRETAEQGRGFLLAVHDEDLVGFAAAGPARDGEPTRTQLFALYVRAAWWGAGVGRRLLDEVAPPGRCSLWVLEPNARARAFYARNGFVADGAREYHDDLGADEIRMVRS